MTTLLPYQTTELSDEIDPCEKSRLTPKSRLPPHTLNLLA